MAAWPTPQDFNEAIQNPRQAFGDAELQAGAPELTNLGLPRPITGGFASVYRMQCGGKSWAVRCFLRGRPDQEERYVAIGEHLARARIPYTVGFRFQRQGIRVRGEWYPILKMEWVPGDPLDEFVSANLHDPAALLALADRWLLMLRALRQATIAHGDLQHSNVFLVRGQLRLLDYDGMYVPALAGLRGAELGHRNYQHPERSERDFGPDLDNFSAWVVYVSLIALSVEPGLWQRFHGGDECLLFRREDFQQPDTSELLRAFDQARDARLHAVAALFRSLLPLAPMSVPALDAQSVPAAPRPASEGGFWIADHLKPAASSPDSAPSAHPPALEVSPPTPVRADPAWILDLVAPQPLPSGAVEFSRSANIERLALLRSFVGLALVCLSVYLTPLEWPVIVPAVLLVLTVNYIIWLIHYHAEPAARDLRAVHAGLRAKDREIREAQRAILRADREKNDLRAWEERRRANIDRNRRIVEQREMRELDSVQAAVGATLASVDRRREARESEEQRALAKVERDLGSRVLTLAGKIQELNYAESHALAAALRALQAEHEDAFLRQFSVAGAQVPNVGGWVKGVLIAAGCRTAADVDYLWVQRIPGIGLGRASALRDWREQLAIKAQATLPRALPKVERARVLARFQSRRVPLERDHDREQDKMRQHEEAIRAHHAMRREALDREEAAANARHREQADQVHARYRPDYEAIDRATDHLTREVDARLAGIDARIAEYRRRVFDLTWQKAKLQRDLTHYARLDFRAYARRIVMGTR